MVAPHSGQVSPKSSGVLPSIPELPHILHVELESSSVLELVIEKIIYLSSFLYVTGFISKVVKIFFPIINSFNFVILLLRTNPDNFASVNFLPV